MTQFNIHMTPEFERDLLKLMRIRHLSTKSEAVRMAIKECLEHSYRVKTTEFSSWIGLGNEAPANKKTKFKSDDDLWK